ncbi:hypothetical protein, partial [Streptomyces sp. MA25(2023)]|uniref:hypothetical protein n=1 Tax=Streptomyces sp. MA25(2023) TaxID=3055078 RepID=UPI0025AFF7A3
LRESASVYLSYSKTMILVSKFPSLFAGMREICRRGRAFGLTATAKMPMVGKAFATAISPGAAKMKATVHPL